MDHIFVGSFENISIHVCTYMIFTKNILIIFQVTEEALRLASTQQTNTTKVATIHLQKLEKRFMHTFQNNFRIILYTEERSLANLTLQKKY